jgi:hypothetical protein
MRLLHATAAAIAAATSSAPGAKSGKRLALARARCRGAAILAAQADQHIERVESQPGVELRHAARAVPPTPARGIANERKAHRRSSALSRRAPGRVDGAGDSGTKAVGRHAARGRRRHVHGTMYNRVVALDADTGKEIWVKDFGNTPSTRASPTGRDERDSAAAGLRHDRRIVPVDFAQRQNGEFTRDSDKAARSTFGRASARNSRGCGLRCRRRRRSTRTSRLPAITHRKLQASDLRAIFVPGICGRASSSGRSTRFRGR